MHRLLTSISLIVITYAALVLPQAAAAQERIRCFDETGFCISGTILNYWERNGGLAVFGYPVTDLRAETVEGRWTGPVQWFERDRLEDHGAAGVLAGRLGARYLVLNGTSWEQFPRVDAAPAGCAYFSETGHSLCEPFLSYWRNNGGLQRFGYPVVEPFNESIGSWSGVVQYFERRRMEHHIEHRGTKYEVLLGLLGRDVLARDVPAFCNIRDTLQVFYQAIAQAPFRDALGCPGEAYTMVEAAAQNFDKGKMIWVNFDSTGTQPSRGRKIFVINAGIAPVPVHTVTDDTWKEGDQESAGLTPPPGKYEPVRGFGKIWRGRRGLGQFLGWATEPERATHAQVQYFTTGGVAIWLQDENTVYVFGPDSYKIYVHTKS